MKKINFKKMLGIAALCFSFSQITLAQCHASFTYTTGSSGLVNFTNTSTGTGSIVYNWHFGDGSSSSSATSPSHSYQYNGTYYVNLTMWDSLANCFDSTSQSINITTGLTCNTAPSFSYSAGSSGQLNFTNTSTNVPTGANYSWGFGDGTGSNQASPSHTYIYNGTYNVSLWISDSSGFCQRSVNQTVTITNGATCNIHVNYTYTLGANGQVVFTNTTTGADTNATIYWNFSDGTSNQLSPTHTYQYNGTYYVNLQMGDSLTPCYGNHTDTITITNAANAPVCGASFADSTQTAGTVNFTNTSWGTTGTTIYSWSFGDGTTSNSISPSHHYINNGTYTVTLSINDSLHSCSSSVTNVVTIGALVCGASFTDSLHSAGAVNFTNTSWGTSGATNYSWSFGDGTTSTATNPSHSYAYNGTYAVTLSITDSSNSCSSSITQSVVITTGNPPPCVASVTFSLHQDSLHTPGVWQASTVYSSQVAYAIWNWGDGTSTNGLYPTHTYSAAGHYNICVTAIASCGDSSTVCQNDSLYRTNGTNSIISVTAINAGVAGIKAITKENAQVSIYPNPSAGLFTLSLTNVIAATVQIDISNILGEVIYSAQEQVSNSTVAKQIDLANTANGAYFMKVIVGGQAYTNKIIINK